MTDLEERLTQGLHDLGSRIAVAPADITADLRRGQSARRRRRLVHGLGVLSLAVIGAAVGAYVATTHPTPSPDTGQIAGSPAASPGASTSAGGSRAPTTFDLDRFGASAAQIFVGTGETWRKASGSSGRGEYRDYRWTGTLFRNGTSVGALLVDAVRASTADRAPTACAEGFSHCLTPTVSGHQLFVGYKKSGDSGIIVQYVGPRYVVSVHMAGEAEVPLGEAYRFVLDEAWQPRH